MIHRDQVFQLAFRIHNRRGLGHLMRSTVIATEILSRAPGTRISFVARTLPGESFRLSGVRYLQAQDADHLGLLPRELDVGELDLLIDDTVLPPHENDDAVRSGVPRAFVMRRSTEQRHEQLLAHPSLQAMRAIVVPHEREEFDHAFPTQLQARAIFTGAVVRRPDWAVGARSLARYGVRASDWLLISTAGGGGFEEDLTRFCSVISQLHRELLPLIPQLKHLVVLGPLSTASMEPQPGLTAIGEEPDLVSLFPLAAAVISAGGYNTVNELRVSGTPALLLPGVRRYDDQFERCERLASRGLAEVIAGRSPELATQQLMRVLLNPTRLHDLRVAHLREPLALGNAAAAQALLEHAGR